MVSSFWSQVSGFGFQVSCFVFQVSGFKSKIKNDLEPHFSILLQNQDQIIQNSGLMIKALIFDWGNTIMFDFGFTGPMSQWEKVAWIEGTENSLKILSPKYICCIATGAEHSGTKNMIDALKRVGADQYFHHFFCAKDLGYKKPSPLFFQAVAENIGLKTSECVMIGDSYDKDIIGAKMAGMKTILLNTNNETAKFVDADYIINSMEELSVIINNIK